MYGLKYVIRHYLCIFSINRGKYSTAIGGKEI